MRILAEKFLERDSLPFYKAELEKIFEKFDPMGLHEDVKDLLLNVCDSQE
jgi:hypothetical protein